MLSLDSVSLQDKKQYNEDLLLAASIHHFKADTKHSKQAKHMLQLLKKGKGSAY